MKKHNRLHVEKPQQAEAQPHSGADLQAEHSDAVQPVTDMHALHSPELNGRQQINAALESQRMQGNRYVQFKAEAGRRPHIDPETSLRIKDSLGQGEALPVEMQVRAQDSLGHDLSDVRLHTGSESDTLVRRTGAAAFTAGRDIFFRQDTFDPSTAKGAGLLGHELAHTVQQGGAINDGNVIEPCTDKALEDEADTAARSILDGEPYSVGSTTPGQLQFGDGWMSRAWDTVTGWFGGGEEHEEGARGAGGERGVGGQVCDMADELQDRLAMEFSQGIEYVLIVPLRDTTIAAITNQAVREALTEARSALRHLPFTVEWIKRVFDLCERESDIREAIRAFTEWGQIDAVSDPEGYAQAAGRALAAVGDLGSDFTPDAFGGIKRYFDILSGCRNIFTQLMHQADPERQLQRSGMFRSAPRYDQRIMDFMRSSEPEERGAGH